MKKKETDNKLRKKVFRLAGVTDYKHLETKYKKMALKGWLIEKVKGVRDTYVELEPIDLDFSVSLFQQRGPLDYHDKKKEMLYKELCEDGGWTYATSNERYQVYHKPAGADATPIHTDPVEEYNTIKSAFFKSEIFMPILIVLQLLPMIFSIKSMRYDSFLSPGGMMSIINPAILIIIISIYFIPVLIWFIKNSQRVKRGETILFESSSRIVLRNSTLVVLTGLYLLYIGTSLFALIFSGIPLVIFGVIPIIIILPIVAGLGMRYKIKNVKHSRKTNLAVLIVVLLVVWIVMVTITFGLLASSRGGNDEAIPAIPDVPILTYTDFLLDLDFEPRRVKLQSSFWSPLNFAYSSRDKDRNEGQVNDIDVEYIETRFDFVATTIVDMILNNERENIEREREYNIEGVSVEDYIYPIKGYEDQVDAIYNISSQRGKVILIKEKIIYIVRLDVPVEDEKLDIVVDKLFGKLN